MKKRILITNGHLHIGGVEKSLVNFLHAIDYSKYEVDLLLFEGSGELLSEIPKEVSVIQCDLTPTYGSFFQVIKNGLKDYKVIWRKAVITLANKANQRYLRFLIKPKEYDIALAYRVGTPMDYVSYGVKAKKRFFWWHHGEFCYPEYQVRHWQRSAQQMDGMICVSNSIKEIVKPYFDSFVKEIIVIPNMISIQNTTEEIRNKESDDISYMVVSVGRLSEEKHMIDCVLAAKKLVEDGYHNLLWYVLGDGPEKERISNEIIYNRLQGVVLCLGNNSNPYTYMKNADLIVHPSYVESQGMTVLEAMALKKLVVAVGSNGVNEYAIDHYNSLIAEKNLDSLVEKIEEAFNLNEDDRISICEAAERTANRYSSDVIMKQIEEDLFAD